MQQGIILRKYDNEVRPEFVVVSGNAVFKQDVEYGTFYHRLLIALRRALFAHSELFYDCGRSKTDNAFVLVDEDFCGVWAWVAFPTRGEWDLCDPGSARAESADFCTKAICLIMRNLIRVYPHYFQNLSDELLERR